MNTSYADSYLTIVWTGRLVFFYDFQKILRRIQKSFWRYASKFSDNLHSFGYIAEFYALYYVCYTKKKRRLR